MDWRRDEVLTLIGHYCRNTCLWDLEDPNYKNRELKREAVHSIAGKMNREVHDVERKMHGLRTQFNREHKRYQKQVLLNGRLREVQKPTWFAYEPLEFVAKCINPRLPKVRMDGMQDYESGDNTGQEATWSGFEVEVENDNGDISSSQIDLTNETAECAVHDEPEIIVQVLEEEPANNGDALHGLKNAGNNLGITNNHLSTLASAVKKENRLFDGEKSFRQPSLKRPRLLNERSLEKVTDFKFEQRQKTPGTPLIEIKDEYAAFAVYVQQELKKISNPYGLQMAKLKINQVLFEGTTGSYDKLPATNSAIKTPNRSQMIITSKIQHFETTQQRVASVNSDIS